ncbi:MAG: alpha-galactosidase [Planctomycetia bacterium]|nr:alpha-galactosidase [Planctomycetia bacterium]
MTPTVALLFSLILGPWNISFDETTSTLTLRSDENIVISGELSFHTGGEAWRIVPPRDNVPTRLAIIDKYNDVQGYISFQQNGTRLALLVSHRTRQFYEGTLNFKGTIQFRENSFPCKTSASPSERVLFLASGRGDSTLNDTLFAPEEDLALQIRAENLRIESLGAADSNVDPNAPAERCDSYALAFSGRIHETAEASFEFNLEKDYYKNRYIPYYRPIDRTRCPKAPTGWMSWNLYFDKATAEDNLAEARLGKKYLQPFGMEFWSIESWQGNSDQLPVSNFYNLNLEVNEKQFPKGMKQLADDIRALGFRPGLWTAPFGTGNKDFYEAHKDWFLHGEDGAPLRTWNGVYTIDPTNDEVIDHLREIHRIASQEWGYEYFKIDGMSGSGGGYCAHFFERPYVKKAFKNPDCPNPFERCVAAFREGIGPDRVFLACQGHFSGPEPAYADAARIGADIVHPNQPVKWANLLNQAGRTINQIFAHNIVFYADPDTLLVNEALSLEEARLSTTVVALPGQMMFSGDKLAELPAERIRLLQQTLPVCDIHPMNMYPIFKHLPVWDLKVARAWGNYDVVALFNWSEEEAQIDVDFAELGLDPDEKYLMYEFWTNSFVGAVSKDFATRVPPHAVRLFAIHKMQDVPQFFTSDRHITQGATDVETLKWDAAACTLSGKVALVGENPTTLQFFVPKGFSFKALDANLADAISTKTYPAEKNVAGGEIFALTLLSPQSKTAEFKIQFSRGDQVTIETEK